MMGVLDLLSLMGGGRDNEEPEGSPRRESHLGYGSIGSSYSYGVWRGESGQKLCGLPGIEGLRSR